MLLTFDTKDKKNTTVETNGSSRGNKIVSGDPQQMVNQQPQSLMTTDKTGSINKSDTGNSDALDLTNKQSDLNAFKFTKKRTNRSCITCKIRKKRCSEERPICSDCSRLGKNCVWATDDMTNDMIRQLKKKVEEEEKNTKKRKVTPAHKRVQKPRTKTPATERSDILRHKTNAPPLSHSSSTSERNPLLGTKAPSASKINDLLNADLFQRHDELLQRSQTPIATHLTNLSGARQNSPFMLAASPAASPRIFQHHGVSGSPEPLWDMASTDRIFEFSTFFENNLKQNSKKRLESDRFELLEGNDNEIHKHNNDDNQDIEVPSLVRSHDEDLPNRLTTIPSRTFVDPLENFDPFNFDILPHPNPTILNIDPMGSHLYDYYVNRLSGIISIVPPESNYYLKCFLPMAAENEGILNAILAWSAYHIGGNYEQEGAKYMTKALDYIQDTPAVTDSEILQRLANLLIMTGAEICKGDVRKWPVFLEWGSKIIKQRGGLFKFKESREQHWLISSFAYHDILTSSSSERGTYFPVEDYQNFMVHLGSGIDPLQGIIKPLLNIIGEISSLAHETKRLLKISSNSLGYGILDDENGNEIEEDEHEEFDTHEIPGIDTPESEKDKTVSRYTSLVTIMSKSSELENKINECKPDPEDLSIFGSQELELQLTLFELFQLTAKLHLRQSVLRLNPSSLETQFILCELLKCVDIVLKSSVEASLCFPLFIAGMNCTTRKDRKMMLKRFNGIILRYNFKNLERARTVMEQVWLIDPSGTRCVDWYEIVKKLNWDLSFA